MIRFWVKLRGAWRFVALFGVILWSVVLYSLDSRHRRDAASKARWLQFTCRRLLRVLAVSVESRGQPAHGAVIVSNHMSYIDIVVMAASTPVVFVSKKEVRQWPLFGWFAEKAGTRFIDRNKRGDVTRIADEIESVMVADLTVVMFLEGTTTDGRGVRPFRSSLLEPAVQKGWQIVPAALGYGVPQGRSVEREICWWGDMTLTPHLLNFTTLSWVKAYLSWGAAMPARGDRKILAAKLHQQVMALKAELGDAHDPIAVF